MFKPTFKRSAPPYKGTKNFIRFLIRKCHCKRLVIKKNGRESVRSCKGRTDFEKSVLNSVIKGAPKNEITVIAIATKIKREEYFLKRDKYFFWFPVSMSRRGYTLFARKAGIVKSISKNL